jgi:hypothetical protein
MCIAVMCIAVMCIAVRCRVVSRRTTGLSPDCSLVIVYGAQVCM